MTSDWLLWANQAPSNKAAENKSRLENESSDPIGCCGRHHNLSFALLLSGLVWAAMFVYHYRCEFHSDLMNTERQLQSILHFKMI